MKKFLFLFVSLSFLVSVAPIDVGSADAATWVDQTAAGTRDWYTITSSSDGTKLAAVVNGGDIYTSTDSGATWTDQTGGGINFASIASSADGTRLVGVKQSGPATIFISTDSGVNWTSSLVTSYNFGVPATPQLIVSSSDGTKLAMAESNTQGHIWTSTDSGANWTDQTAAGGVPARQWKTLASSADGTKLVAAAGNGHLYTSTNSGVNWTDQAGAGVRVWKGIASSADGTKLAAVNSSLEIQTSVDSGVTWTNQTGSGALAWRSITSSADGTKLAASVTNGEIYLSSDSGVTWTASGAGSRNWAPATGTVGPPGIVSSSDGNKIAAMVYAGDIYTTNLSSAAPSLTTSSASSVSTSTATLNGSITATGGVDATQSGFAYGTSATLATAATSTLGAQTGTASFLQNLSGLTPNTTYYFRAYATNTGGTGYGAIVSFATTDTTAPTVSLTAPSNGATVSGASVSLTADASDDVAVAGVQFKLDTNTPIGAEDTTSTYGIAWDSTAVSDGSHTILAVARDAAGNLATSTSVTVTVDNTAPVRSGGSPSGALALNTTSTTLSLTTNETATCKYSTSSGTGYGSMTAFSTTNGTSHSTSVSGLSNGGSYTYYVKCSDAQSNTNATDYTISFTVTADASAPAVSLTAPDNNDTVSGTIALSATASDDVAVAGVQFKLDDAFLGAEDTSAPYETTWDTTTALDGTTHTLVAVARDSSNFLATSSVVTVTVDNAPPATDPAEEDEDRPRSNGGSAPGFYTTTTQSSASSPAGLTTAQVQSILTLLRSFDADASVIANVAASLATPSTPHFIFTQPLYLGLQGVAVQQLQTLLATFPAFYPEGQVTGYFGPLTKAAVGRLQLHYHLAQPGDVAYGYVGPGTRAVLNGL